MSKTDPRKVKRVLVMIEPDNADAGGQSEVYDLTAVVREMAERSDGHLASIDMVVRSQQDYSQRLPEGGYRKVTTLAWRAYIMGGRLSAAESGYLEDVVAAEMPDTEHVQRLTKAHLRAKEKMEKLQRDIDQARLEAAAEVRHQHPIARVRINPEALPGGSAP